MAGIISIGWYVPEGRRDVAQLARDYGVSETAIRALGVVQQAVAKDSEHPSTMGAWATKSALSAAGLKAADVDLLIFAGMTRDHPPPWVGAFGVLHELGNSTAAGFDVSARCAAVHDALWLASGLLESGAYKTAVVCCADRFDYLLGPPRKALQVSDCAYSAGAASAVLTRDASNSIVAFSHLTNDDLSLHAELCPGAGGSREPLSAALVADGAHQWRNRMKLSQAAPLREYLFRADRHNISRVCKAGGFETPDFVACAPLDAKAQLDSLAQLGIGSDRTFLTLPAFGHMGPADSLASLGMAAVRRKLGPNVVMSTRSALYSNALAIKSRKTSFELLTAGSPKPSSLGDYPLGQLPP